MCLLHHVFWSYSFSCPFPSALYPCTNPQNKTKLKRKQANKTGYPRRIPGRAQHRECGRNQRPQARPVTLDKEHLQGKVDGQGRFWRGLLCHLQLPWWEFETVMYFKEFTIDLRHIPKHFFSTEPLFAQLCHTKLSWFYVKLIGRLFLRVYGFVITFGKLSLNSIYKTFTHFSTFSSSICMATLLWHLILYYCYLFVLLCFSRQGFSG